jgi:hypothetical protein
MMGIGIATLAWPKAGQATTARAVSLHDLVQRSARIARTTALESSAHTEDIGGTRHIVSYTRLRVDDLIHGASGESEILVRTLGGRIGELGEIVHGEAELALNESCLVFLHTNPDGIEQVTAMAQGHYPLALDAAGAPRLHASRNMPHLLGSAPSAVAQLNGLRFTEARSLILGARH